MSENVFHTDWQKPRWHVLFVRSNQEKRVARHLCDRGVDYFLPCFESLRQWKDRRVKLQLPLFPGYIFVHVRLLERAKVLTVPNVISLAGSKHAPSFVSAHEIAWIRHCIDRGLAEPHEYLKVGERVVITEGALAGMEGILLEKRNGARIVVALDSIARAFVVEVDAALVKSVGSSRKHSASLPAGYPAIRDITDKPEQVYSAETISAVNSAERLSSGREPFEGHGGY